VSRAAQRRLDQDRVRPRAVRDERRANPLALPVLLAVVERERDLNSAMALCHPAGGASANSAPRGRTASISPERAHHAVAS
jgi:hypothetical protein